MSLDVDLISDVCDQCGHGGIVYPDNTTHNLGVMADVAGIYMYLWRPEELNIAVAEDLITPLTSGLNLLYSDPARFQKLDAPNGWGTYMQLVRFVSGYLDACKKYPKAKVVVSR